MELERMHFTGPVWRPPYEANSLLLQATVGCTHDNCKFCSLYPDTKFRMSPLSEIIEDLLIASIYQPRARRVFLTGANPFVMTFDKLAKIARLIKEYLPEVQNIGTFARITDIRNKTVEQLKELHHLGYDRITIGTESGDDTTLDYMRKGYKANDIIEQCRKLEAAGVEYNFSYLVGLAGKGNGIRNAFESARIFSQLHPFIVSIVSLTVFPESDLYQDIQDGLFIESSEIERLEEMKVFITNLKPDNEVTILANTVSNPVPITGILPRDRDSMLMSLQSIIDNVGEKDLRKYREGIVSL